MYFINRSLLIQKKILMVLGTEKISHHVRPLIDVPLNGFDSPAILDALFLMNDFLLIFKTEISCTPAILKHTPRDEISFMKIEIPTIIYFKYIYLLINIFSSD